MCRSVARGHYENFLVATVLLPRSMRQPFYDVYAFCRTADDVADESPTPGHAIDALCVYREAIDRLYSGHRFDSMPDNSNIFVALADTVARFNLPRQPFDDLLDAFMRDQSKTRYSDEKDLAQYCRQSANPVGRLVLAMADCDNETNRRLSDEICTGLQLANFWQDVARDHAIGRIYLPKTVMDRFRFDENLIAATIAAREPTPAAVRDAIADQCRKTRSKFENGMPLIRNVPRWLSVDIELFIGGGLATLEAIEKIGFDVLQTRPTVGKWRQTRMLTRSLFRRTFSRFRSDPKIGVGTVAS